MPLIAILTALAVFLVSLVQAAGHIDKSLAALIMVGIALLAVFAVLWESIGRPNGRRMAPVWREPQDDTPRRAPSPPPPELHLYSSEHGIRQRIDTVRIDDPERRRSLHEGGGGTHAPAFAATDTPYLANARCGTSRGA